MQILSQKAGDFLVHLVQAQAKQGYSIFYTNWQFRIVSGCLSEVFYKSE